MTEVCQPLAEVIQFAHLNSKALIPEQETGWVQMLSRKGKK